jgi:hypothetical protein
MTIDLKAIKDFIESHEVEFREVITDALTAPILIVPDPLNPDGKPLETVEVRHIVLNNGEPHTSQSIGEAVALVVSAAFIAAEQKGFVTFKTVDNVSEDV